MAKKQQKPNILWLFNEGPGQQYFRHVSQAIRNAGGNPVVFDYINEYDVTAHDVRAAKMVFNQNFSEDDLAKALINPEGSTYKHTIEKVRSLSDKKLRQVVEKFIKKNDITGIFLPGDYFNYDRAPFHPSPQERPRYSKILLDVAKEQNLPVFGVCGGLQTIAHYENIAIRRVDDMVAPEEAKNHALNEQASTLQETIRRQLVLPQTRLGRFMKNISDKFGLTDLTEQYIYVPEAYRAAIDNSWENRILIKNKGYKINAVSSDGIIQGLEHETYPITGFQGHPEVLAARKEPVALKMVEHFLIEPARARMKSNQMASGSNVAPSLGR